MAVSTENVVAEIQGWLRENVTGGREVPPDEPIIENGVLTSLQTVELVRQGFPDHCLDAYHVIPHHDPAPPSPDT